MTHPEKPSTEGPTEGPATEAPAGGPTMEVALLYARMARARGMAQALASVPEEATLEGIREVAREIMALLEPSPT